MSLDEIRQERETATLLDATLQIDARLAGREARLVKEIFSP